MVNIIDIHQDLSKEITIESIPGYRDRIRAIVMDTIKDSNSSSSELTESI